MFYSELKMFHFERDFIYDADSNRILLCKSIINFITVFKFTFSSYLIIYAFCFIFVVLVIK